MSSQVVKPVHHIAAPNESTGRVGAELAQFFRGIQNSVLGSGAVSVGAAMDSIYAKQEKLNSANDNSNVSLVPESLAKLFDTMGLDQAQQGVFVGYVMDACSSYAERHCRPVAPDVLRYAIELATALEENIDSPQKLIIGGNSKGVAMDSIFNNASDPLSLQPNRAIVAIIGAITEAIPIAAYLPADIGSNEARLIIASAYAAIANGAYAAEASLSGVDMGNPYLLSTRYLRISSNGGTGLAFAVHRDILPNDLELPDTASPPVKIYRARTNVYVNGIPCATDRSSENPTVTNSIVGRIVLAGTEYQISGTVNSSTGTGTVNSAPALPANTLVHVESVINYEDGQEDLTPSIGVRADMYKLLANANRSKVILGIDSATQFANEVGLDPMATATLNIRAQYQTERHYNVLRMATNIARSFPEQFDFDWVSQGQQKSRSDIVRDLSATFEVANQKMVERTNGVPLAVAYVGKQMLSVLNTLGSDYFAKASTPQTPNIRFCGVLFGKYAIYYNPRIVEGPTTSTILGCGMATDTARNPVIFGDAVPMMMLPIATTDDLKQKSAWYSRSITAITPYIPSAQAFCAIEVIGLPVHV